MSAMMNADSLYRSMIGEMSRMPGTLVDQLHSTVVFLPLATCTALPISCSIAVYAKEEGTKAIGGLAIKKTTHLGGIQHYHAAAVLSSFLSAPRITIPERIVRQAVVAAPWPHPRRSSTLPLPRRWSGSSRQECFYVSFFSPFRRSYIGQFRRCIRALRTQTRNPAFEASASRVAFCVHATSLGYDFSAGERAHNGLRFGHRVRNARRSTAWRGKE